VLSFKKDAISLYSEKQCLEAGLVLHLLGEVISFWPSSSFFKIISYEGGGV